MASMRAVVYDLTMRTAFAPVLALFALSSACDEPDGFDDAEPIALIESPSPQPAPSALAVADVDAASRSSVDAGDGLRALNQPASGKAD